MFYARLFYFLKQTSSMLKMRFRVAINWFVSVRALHTVSC
jgi:hypothetical protein